MFTFLEIALSLAVLATFITLLSLCVCGCKNSNQKSELVGTAGVVTIRLEEEAPSPTPTTPASVKRASAQNSQRSLPEIPHPVGRHDSGDTASEIYATVNLDEGNKNVVPTTSTNREHPYEHAYAKLQNESHNITVEITPDQTSENDIAIDERDAAQSVPDSVVISASVAISGQLPSSQELPYITPPEPRSMTDNAVHFSGDSTDSAKGYTSISVREPLSNIRAVSVSRPPHNYATVSDDSDEMYAAIEEASVGEGSDTYAQIAPSPTARIPPVDTSLHTRRSAPPEIGSTSTTRSTHSRQASSSSCTNSTGALGSPKPEKRQANSPLPPPPALNQLNPHNPPNTHSILNPHSGSNTHNVLNSHNVMNSHNNHAPHTTHTIRDSQRHHRISSTGDLHLNHDKLRRSLNEKHQRNNSCVSSSDFYGCNYPVADLRYSASDINKTVIVKSINIDISDSKDNSAHSDYSSTDPNVSANSEQRITESPIRNVEEMYAKVMKKTKTKEERRSRDMSETPNTSTFRGDDPGYETIERNKPNHGYETIARKERQNSNQDPGYETVKDISKTSNNNNLLKQNHLNVESGPNSIVSSDPGYEHISRKDTNASDSDPNYEVLRNGPPTPPYATIASNYNSQPTYSTVNKKPGKYNSWHNNNDDAVTEPNYESMPHEPLYNTGSESDPNYESVRPKDPNYESVNTNDPNYESLRCKDPKYASVRSKDSKYDSLRSRKDPNYESVKYFDLPQKEPPYERLNNEPSASSAVERSDSAAGYEKINIKANGDAKNSINHDASISDYFQV